MSLPHMSNPTFAAGRGFRSRSPPGKPYGVCRRFANFRINYRLNGPLGSSDPSRPILLGIW